MNIRNLTLILLMVCALTLSGCALFDSMVLKPLTNPQGEQLYLDVTASTPEVPVLVTEAEMEPGHQYEPQYDSKPSEGVDFVSMLLGLIPGWGTVAKLIPGFLVAGYAALRGRKKLAEMKVLADKWAVLAKHGIKVVEALKSYKWDVDEDGKISAEEVTKGIVEVVRQMGQDAQDPAFLADVVAAMTGSFTPTQRQAILEAVASQTKP
jgi:hypothetical protein